MVGKLSISCDGSATAQQVARRQQHLMWWQSYRPAGNSISCDGSATAQRMATASHVMAINSPADGNSISCDSSATELRMATASHVMAINSPADGNSISCDGSATAQRMARASHVMAVPQLDRWQDGDSISNLHTTAAEQPSRIMDHTAT